MRNHRADAVKQGRSCRRRIWWRSGLSPPTPATCRRPATSRKLVRSCATSLAHALEGILAPCAAVSRRTGRVARAYAAAALADQPTAARSLGTTLGWSEATVLRELHTVKRIARQVLRKRGVSAPVADSRPETSYCAS
jgi:hypothetical protein